MNEDKEGLAFQRDDTVTRFNLRLRAEFRLTRVGSDDVLMKGVTRAIAAYNVVQSDYANLIAERDAQRRASRQIAEDISLRVAIFFSRNRQGRRAPRDLHQALPA